MRAGAQTIDCIDHAVAMMGCNSREPSFVPLRRRAGLSCRREMLMVALLAQVQCADLRLVCFRSNLWGLGATILVRFEVEMRLVGIGGHFHEGKGGIVRIFYAIVRYILIGVGFIAELKPERGGFFVVF